MAPFRPSRPVSDERNAAVPTSSSNTAEQPLPSTLIPRHMRQALPCEERIRAGLEAVQARVRENRRRAERAGELHVPFDNLRRPTMEIDHNLPSSSSPILSTRSSIDLGWGKAKKRKGGFGATGDMGISKKAKYDGAGVAGDPIDMTQDSEEDVPVPRRS
jgi:hypothetical protein